MRILYYSPHPLLKSDSCTGYGTHIREMIAAFKELGHTVEALILGDSTNTTANTNLPPGKSRTKQVLKKLIPSLLWQTIKDITLIRFDRTAETRLKKVILTFKPDLIYERTNYLQTSGIKCAKSYGVKHFSEINSPYILEKKSLEGKSLLTAIAKNREKKLLSDTDHIFVVSSALRDYLTESSGVNNEKFTILPNAVNFSQIKIDEKEVETLKNMYKEGVDRIYGFVGSFFEWHGLFLLIDSFLEFHKKYSNSKLIIVGSGEIFSAIETRIKEHNAEDYIILTGDIEHSKVFNYIALMDVCIMPDSNWYGSPVKIFEYGAMNKPIIAPDNGPLQDIMTQNEDGILIESVVSELCKAMEIYYLNTTIAEKYSNSFHRKVIKKHLWKYNAEKVLESFS